MGEEITIQKVYNDFVKFLFSKFRNFNVSVLFSELEIFGIIDGSEKCCINRGNGDLMEMGRILFMEIMPPKDASLHDSFVDILRNKSLTELANYLASKLSQLREQEKRQEDANATATPPAPSPAAPPTASPSAGQSDPGLEEAAAPNEPQSTVVLPQLPDPQLLPPEPGQTSLRPLVHTQQSYEEELSALGEIPDTKGNLAINVQRTLGVPFDINENEYYELSCKLKGLALIINNKNYKYGDYSGDYSNRIGSEVDCANMQRLLSDLGYQVSTEQNRTADQMLNDVCDFATLFSAKQKYQSCIMVLMTHGDYGKFIGVDGRYLDQEIFFKAITENEALAEIPKIFIIQACRGSKPLFPAKYRDRHSSDDDASDGPVKNRLSRIELLERRAMQAFVSATPIGANMCVLHSTTPGHFSWRNTVRGSWFIQAICQEFNEHAHKPWADLMTLAIRVIKRVGTTFVAQTGCVQLPHVEFNMMKKFHLFPGPQRTRSV